VGTVSALSYYQALALPMVRIKQQQPTPVLYIVTLTGKFNTNDAGAIAIIFVPFSNLRDLIIEDNFNNTFR